MLRIRSNVVTSSILHHVRHLGLRDAAVSVIYKKMLAVVLVPNGVAFRSHERSVYIRCIYAAAPPLTGSRPLHGRGALPQTAVSPAPTNRIIHAMLSSGSLPH
jgi:hypothetical protein